jgi:hypothetical protein
MGSDKLRNVDAVKKLLAGEHRTQTRTTTGGVQTIAEKRSADRKYRNVGETWYEYDQNGNVERVVTKIGIDVYDIRSEYMYLREINGDFENQHKFKNCPKPECTCTVPTRLDEKFRVLEGKCFDCHIEYETQLKIEGKFNDYAKNIILNNAKAYFKDTDAQFEDVKKELRSGVSYGHGDGSIEKWEASTGDPDTIIKKIEEEYTTIKDNTIRAIENSGEVPPENPKKSVKKKKK